MLRIHATNLPSPRRAVRSRELAPRPPIPRSSTLPPPRSEFASEPPTERLPLRSLLPDDVGPPTKRMDVTPTKPFKPPSIPAAGALPPPPRLPSELAAREVLPPELAAQPVTGNTMSPTTMDTAPAPTSPSPSPRWARRPLELAGVGLAAFALAWVSRGTLQPATHPTEEAARLALSQPAAATTALPLCEERPRATTTSSDIRTVSLSELPLLGESAGPDSAPHATATHAPARNHSNNSGSNGVAPTRASLVAALNRVAGAAASCRDRGGPVKVVLTFNPSGVARSIRVSGKDLPSSTRSCIANAAARARVPAFEGDPVTASKTL